MGLTWTLYRFKVRAFVGPVLRQPATLAAFVLLALVFLPGAVAMGYFLPDLPWAAAGLEEIGAMALSMLLAFNLPTALAGGLVLHPAEVDFAATTPVTVRRLALADLLFQGTIQGTGLVVAGLGAIGYTVRTGAPPWAFLVPVAAFLLLGLTFVLTVQALGIARLVRKRWAGAAIGVVFVLLLLPAILRFALSLESGYAGLPYPSTAAVEVALLPFGEGSWTGLPILLGWLGLAAAANLRATARASLPNLRPAAALAVMFEPAAQKRMQQEAMTRLFGRFRRAGGARLHDPSLTRTMMRLHLARMARDGTLFMMAILCVLFGAIYLGVPEAGASNAGFVVLVLPIAVVGQWMVSDRPNLWLVAVSGQRPEAFFRGWWLGLGAITATLGVAISMVPTLLRGTVDLVSPILLAGAALGAVALAIVAAARWPYNPSTFSFRPFVHLLLGGIGAGLGGLPVLAAWFVALAFAPPIAPLAGLGMLAFVFVLCDRIVVIGAARPEV